MRQFILTFFVAYRARDGRIFDRYQEYNIRSDSPLSKHNIEEARLEIAEYFAREPGDSVSVVLINSLELAGDD